METKKIDSGKVEYKHGIMKIDGKYYKPDMSSDGKGIFVEIPEKEYTEKMDLAKKITEKLKDNLDREKILMEALMKVPMKDLKKLDGIIHNPKRKYIPRTRENHCVDMKIGAFILPIVD